MSKYVRKPPGYITLADLMKDLGLNTTARLRNDIKLGILPAERMPSNRDNEPYLVKVEDAEIYKKKYHTPVPVPVA